MKLDGKIAVITGGGSGMGRSIACRFAEEGASIVIFDINIVNASDVSRGISSTGSTAIGLLVDVGDYLQVKKAVRNVIRKFSRIDILINGAGLTYPCLPEKMTERLWDNIVTVNLKGVFNCCRWVLPHMYTNHYGRIVNISSIAGISGTPLHTHYAAAKGGVIAYTRALAKAVAEHGQITCNCLSPAFIDTPFYDFDREALEKARASIPLGRLGSPDDVASACLYLVSDEASFITGANLNISGGAFIFPV